MKNLFLSLTLILFFGAVAIAGDGSYDMLKSFAGTWEGKLDNGDGVTLTYNTVSNGAAVMETLAFSDGSSMVSMYHQNGEKIMLTHYCASNNQPRLESNSTNAKPNELNFTFKDITNHKEGQSHLYAVSLTKVDDDHLKQDVVFKGKNEMKMDIVYTRKK